jgi:hypothetical protein
MQIQLELVNAGVFGDHDRAATRKTSFSMRPDSWFGKFWTRIKTGVVQDVPPSLEECEACREVNCTQERWLTCPRRLASMHEGDAVQYFPMPSATGRTDEMPGLGTSDSPQNQPAESETFEGCARRKKISSSGD